MIRDKARDLYDQGRSRTCYPWHCMSLTGYVRRSEPEVIGSKSVLAGPRCLAGLE